MIKKLLLIACAIIFVNSAVLAQAPKIRLSATSPHSVTLTCSPGAGVTPSGYNFFKGTKSGGESTTPVNSSPISTCNYVDTAVSAATQYFYTATEIVGGVSSGPSAEVSGTVPVFSPGAASLVINGTTGAASWSPSPDGAAAYNVYIGTSPGGESSTPANASLIDAGCTSTSTCTYQLAGLTVGDTYYIVVKAVINGISSPGTAEVSGSVTVPPPSGLQMTTQ